LVLGGRVNGYSIIQELNEKGVKEIFLFDVEKRVAAFSNKIKKYKAINNTADNLHSELNDLHKEYEKIIIFPSDDLYLENLHKIYDKIQDFCFVPINNNNFMECSNKYVQYEYCEKLGVPYPKTKQIVNKDDLRSIDIHYPILIKPNKREDLKVNVFRNVTFESEKDLHQNIGELEKHIDSGISFLASEIIPGDGSCIYAYVGYRNKNGEILNEWTGKKLSQFPDDFGVFSSASNEASDTVRIQGRTLLEGMNIYGIAEPEFKYDHRDGKYKLTEINLRSMMWHRVGNLSGVNIQYSQYLDALGKSVSHQDQIKNRNIHFVYLKHEIINLISRPGYSKIFYHNIFTSDETHFATFDKKDLKPFIVDCKETSIDIINTCLRKLKIKH
jgi:D-aspartate ligase